LVVDSNYTIIPTNLLENYRRHGPQSFRSEYIYHNPQSTNYQWYLTDDIYLFDNLFIKIKNYMPRASIVLDFYHRLIEKPPSIPIITMLRTLLDCYVSIYYIEKIQAKLLSQLLGYIWVKQPEIRPSFMWPAQLVVNNLKYCGTDVNNISVTASWLVLQLPQLCNYFSQQLVQFAKTSSIGWLIDSVSKLDGLNDNQVGIFYTIGQIKLPIGLAVTPIDDPSHIKTDYVGRLITTDPHFWSKDHQNLINKIITRQNCELQSNLKFRNYRISPNRSQDYIVYSDWGSCCEFLCPSRLDSELTVNPVQLFRTGLLNLNQGLQLLEKHLPQVYEKLMSTYPTLAPYHQFKPRCSHQLFPDYIEQWLQQHLPISTYLIQKHKKVSCSIIIPVDSILIGQEIMMLEWVRLAHLIGFSVHPIVGHENIIDSLNP